MMRNLMLCILLLSTYASAEVRFYGSLGKLHPAGNGPNHLFPPTTQQTNSNHGNRGNRQILQTRRTNPYSHLFHRKFSDGLKMK